MIYLEKISDSVVNKHWAYFISSTGYSNLVKLSNDNNIPQSEQEYFARLLSDEQVLKSIITGKPSELIAEIQYYHEEVINRLPLLKLHQIFLSLFEWDNIYEQINRKAEEKQGVTVINDRKTDFYEKLHDLMEDINDPQLIFEDKPIKLTIKYLRSLFDTLKGYFNLHLDRFYKRIYSVFDYEDFIMPKKLWYAYVLTRELGVNVCPYCNRNYIHTSISEHGKTRAELDHFYSKSKYPFLSISLYNLIPSCHTCNSNLKRAKDFYVERHLHPYENNYLNYFQFEMVYKDNMVGEIVVDLNKFDIQIKTLTDDPSITELINNSNKTFQLTELYNYHKDIAQELIVRSIYYNETKIEELRKLLGEDIDINDDFLKRVIVGNYADVGNFGKRPLAKYSYDILSKTDLKTILNL